MADSKSDFTHCITMPVRWRDLDALGHVNNATYFTYLELGRVEYCDQVLDVQFNPDSKQSWILADIQCSYRQQIHYPETLEICTRISQLGNKSATINASIYRKGEDTPVATSQAIVVWFNFEVQQTERIPDVIRGKVIEYEKSVETA